MKNMEHVDLQVWRFVFNTMAGAYAERELAKNYFGKHYGVDWNAIYDYYYKWDDILKMYIKTPYTIEDRYPTY